MNIYSKNQNRNKYLILDQRGDTALLAQIGQEKYIIAYGFDRNATSWGQGRYYWNLKEAFHRFYKKEKEGE